jgi:GTP cyclohydrolase I
MTTVTNNDHAPVGAPLPPKPVDLDTLERGVTLLLQGLGQSDKTEVMANTPRRIAEMYGDIINAAWCDIEIPWKTFPNPAKDDVLITVTDCHYVSLCEHHLMPALGVAHFAYVPDQKITGYSKVKKGLNYLARQPQLNERLLVETLDALESVLEPRGVALSLASIHMCLICKSNAPSQEVVVVTGYRGCLREDPWRREFQSLATSKPHVFGA